MSTFRFAIMGAGNIAHQFCDAVTLVEDCEVSAIASKDLGRARKFAEECSVAHAYDNYEQMLVEEKPDCVYIAVTPNDHFRLTMLCLEHRVPVLCEKAMFTNSAEAKAVFEKAEKDQTFVMEAMWSRFLPAVNQAKKWAAEGKIGRLEALQGRIGFLAPERADNRYHSPLLCGGAATDITVYAYEIATWLVNEPVRKTYAAANLDQTGVDLTDQVTVKFEHVLADLVTSFAAPMGNSMVIYGREGRIELPDPHYASKCFLYGADGMLKEEFTDTTTQKGFTYEIEETIRCVRAKKTESPVVPHATTIACAELFDQIQAAKKE